MLKRIFLREKNLYCSKMKSTIKIGVIGISYNVGCTFIATSLAQEACKTNKVAFVEICNKSKIFAYDIFAMEKRFTNKGILDSFRAVKNKQKICNIKNIDNKINWHIKIPHVYNQLSPLENSDLELCSIINNVEEEVVICDIDSSMINSFIISEMDVLLAVIDPMPSKLINGYDCLSKIKKLKSEGKKIIFIVNKYNADVDKVELHDFINEKDIRKIQEIELKNFYKMEYNCKMPYECAKIKTLIEKEISSIKNEILK